MIFRGFFLPGTQTEGQRRLTLVTSLIALFGIWLYQWQVSEIIYLFMWDFFLIGASTVLRMLFARGGHDTIIGKVIWAAGFAVLYLGLTAILISFLLINLNIESFGSNLSYIKTAIWIIGANHLYAFLFGYILNEANRTTTLFGQLFATMFYVLPLTLILVLAIFPNSLIMGEAHQNSWIAGGIVIIRLIFDYLSLWLGSKVNLNVQEED